MPLTVAGKGSVTRRLSLECDAIIADFAGAADQGVAVARITIRNLDEAVVQRLRIRAAEHGRSMEEEAREILRRAVGDAAPPRDLGRAIHDRFAALAGVDLEFPVRGPMRERP